jgi:hypothetical protein
LIRRALPALLVLAACATEPLGPGSDGWRRFENEVFSFAAPDDVREYPVQGIDSLVGRFESAGLFIDFDCGFYSDPSFDGHRDRAGFEVEPVTIAGVAAELGSYDDGAYPPTHPFVYAAYFAELVPAVGDEPATALSFRVCCTTADALPTARSILESIELR